MNYQTIVKGFAIGALVILAACSKTDDNASEFAVEDIVAPDTLYNQALANLDSGDLKRAQKRIEDLNRQHPYSELSRRSS